MAAPLSQIIFCQILANLLWIYCSTTLVVCEDDIYSLVVEHSLDSGRDAVFSRRGIIDMRSLKSGVADYSDDSFLTDNDKTKLKRLAESDDIYRVRVGKWTSDEKSTSYVYSFTKACSIYESRLSDILIVHIDQSGSLLSTSLTSAAPYCQGFRPSPAELKNFNTTVEVQQTVNGPAPDVQAYIQKLEHEKQEKAKGQLADNRSFFSKYWMYLVPLFIFMMLLHGDQGAAGGGGGARG